MNRLDTPAARILASLAGYAMAPVLATIVGGPLVFGLCRGLGRPTLSALLESLNAGLFLHVLLVPCFIVHVVVTVAQRTEKLFGKQVLASLATVFFGVLSLHLLLAIAVCQATGPASTVGLGFMYAPFLLAPQLLAVWGARSLAIRGGHGGPWPSGDSFPRYAAPRMIGYTTLGTADFERAQAFYDLVLAELGGRLLYANEREAYWGHDPEGIKFAVVRPLDGEPPSVANGSMVALRAERREQVDASYRVAIEQGGTDEGEPGSRGEGSFYGAYFRDLDGHKVCVFLT